MSAPNPMPGQDPDEVFVEQSGDGPEADCGGDVDGEAPLCLKVASQVFPIYALGDQDFAVALSAKSQFESICPFGSSDSELEESQDRLPEQIVSGHLFTGDGEVSIPVNFCVGRVEGPLLFCNFERLSPESARILRDLVELLTNDWEDQQQAVSANQTADASHSDLKFSEQELSESGESTSFELSADESATGAAVTSNASRRPKFVLISLGFAAVVAFFGSRILTGDSVNSDQISSELPTASQGLVTNVPAEAVQESDIRGKIIAEQTLLRSPTAGIVTELFAEVGQTVDIDQPIATIRDDVVDSEQRRLTSELNLAEAQLQAAQTRLEEANKRIRFAKQKLFSNLTALQDAFGKAESERQLASRRWQEIEPLAEHDNIGRKEVESAKKALSEADNTYSDLKESISQIQNRLDAADIEEQLANELGLSVPSLEADLSVAKARIIYLREQMELGKDSTPLSAVKASQPAIISQFLVSTGSHVEADQAICELQVSHRRLVELNVSTSIAAKYQVGAVVLLRLADSDASISATVDEVLFKPIRESGDSPENLTSDSQNMVTLRLALAPNLHTLPLGTIVVLDHRP